MKTFWTRRLSQDRVTTIQTTLNRIQMMNMDRPTTDPLEILMMKANTVSSSYIFQKKNIHIPGGICIYTITIFSTPNSGSLSNAVNVMGSVVLYLPKFSTSIVTESMVIFSILTSPIKMNVESTCPSASFIFIREMFLFELNLFLTSFLNKIVE
ncbi:122R [Cherax quadricarinatus iridovirus]|uniref:122R n=1 Tax=Cherax quadricarinatus iridovirus TaxID=2035708 RepID=UPI000BC00092|nr:122R [Cherax quadricarinatus iridovirus]ASZ85102.1 122R [Cherax quadricarinatus iridovirus]